MVVVRQLAIQAGFHAHPTHEAHERGRQEPVERVRACGQVEDNRARHCWPRRFYEPGNHLVRRRYAGNMRSCLVRRGVAFGGPRHSRKGCPFSDSDTKPLGCGAGPAGERCDDSAPQHGPSCGPFDAADRSRQLNNLKPARPDVACELRARSSRLRRGFLPFLPPWNTPKRNGDRRVTRTYAEEAGR